MKKTKPKSKKKHSSVRCTPVAATGEPLPGSDSTVNAHKSKQEATPREESASHWGIHDIHEQSKYADGFQAGVRSVKPEKVGKFLVIVALLTGYLAGFLWH